MLSTMNSDHVGSLGEQESATRRRLKHAFSADREPPQSVACSQALREAGAGGLAEGGRLAGCPFTGLCARVCPAIRGQRPRMPTSPPSDNSKF